ncbi:hypothetical protein ABH911_004571 [Pseudomonas protegens]|uniref:hypothetical protein n=1 Tax=Pseudomonas protegens TaxID=380021 RepID=UPI0035121BC6
MLIKRKPYGFLAETEIRRGERALLHSDRRDALRNQASRDAARLAASKDGLIGGGFTAVIRGFFRVFRLCYPRSVSRSSEGRNMDPVLLFMVYRMLIVAGGILCIYFGYRLFYVVQLKQGEFKIKTGENYEVSLSDVAPGVFFALFGAGILVFCLTNGITIKPVPASMSEASKPSKPQSEITNQSPIREAPVEASTRKDPVEVSTRKEPVQMPAPANAVPRWNCMSQRADEC